MKKAIAAGIVGVSLSLGMMAFGYQAGNRANVAASEAQPVPSAQESETVAMDRAGIEALVHSYLISNPEVLIEVQQALTVKQREQERLAHLDVITSANDDIFNASYDGVIGNPEGSVTIVEFFDYNCGYCQRAAADMEALIADNPDLRFVLKEFPILGPDSLEAHIVSMAFLALAPEKYGEFHRDLLLSEGRATQEVAIRLALSHGADEAALREEMENPAIEEAFTKTYELANRLSVTGTPSYVVGDEVVYGAIGEDLLAEKIASARDNGA